MGGRERWGNVYTTPVHDGGYYGNAGPQQGFGAARHVGGARANPLQLQGPDAYHVPSWKGMSDPRRIAMLRGIVHEYGRDPRVATLAVNIIRDAGAQPREYRKQGAALLQWVQQNIYYVNEPGERLQSPEYTLRVGYGD